MNSTVVIEIPTQESDVVGEYVEEMAKIIIGMFGFGFVVMLIGFTKLLSKKTPKQDNSV